MEEDFSELQFIEARRARGPMKNRLMRREGGACYLKVGNVTRLLSHSPLDAPEIRLPWPLSKMQPHGISYVEWTGEARTVEQRFKGSQVKVAIEYFLRDVDPLEEVQLQP